MELQGFFASLSRKANLTTPLPQGYHAIKKTKTIPLHIEGVLHDRIHSQRNCVSYSPPGERFANPCTAYARFRIGSRLLLRPDRLAGRARSQYRGRLPFSRTHGI